MISNTHQVPLAEDDCALSSGYAAAMDAAMHGNHYGVGRHQDPEETTPSDVSERPSVDDVESDTGSTGALETRSLKDHKGDTFGHRLTRGVSLKHKLKIDLDSFCPSKRGFYFHLSNSYYSFKQHSGVHMQTCHYSHT